jgi:hypothetical protein
MHNTTISDSFEGQMIIVIICVVREIHELKDNSFQNKNKINAKILAGNHSTTNLSRKCISLYTNIHAFST